MSDRERREAVRLFQILAHALAAQAPEKYRPRLVLMESTSADDAGDVLRWTVTWEQTLPARDPVDETP